MSEERKYSIREQALKEIEEQKFREAVEREKARIRLPWLKRLFPWRIKLTIERRTYGIDRR